MTINKLEYLHLSHFALTLQEIRGISLMKWSSEMTYNGAKLAVASVARATPLFLPRPEFIYITVVHYSAPPRTFLLRATPPLCPDWRH